MQDTKSPPLPRRFLLANMIKYAQDFRFVYIYQRNPEGITSLLTQCESNNTKYKELLSLIFVLNFFFSDSEIISFSKQRSEVFYEFSKPLIYAIFICSLLKSQFWRLGSRDEIANFVWFDRILLSTKLFWLNYTDTLLDTDETFLGNHFEKLLVQYFIFF